MKSFTVLEGKKVFLRDIDINDCTETYLSWLNDPEVNQYLETKWHEQTIDSIKAFVQSVIDSDNSMLFAIIDKETDYHIGNIKIGPIHSHYKHADISYFIGNKKMWGSGRATEAIKLVCKYGFDVLELHRIEAGTYDCAIGSQKVLEKNFFKREAIYREQVYYKNRYIDIFRYGLLKKDIVSNR